jgi:hypothetical protein
MANTKITSRVIADNAVTTAAIADDAVHTAKIADDAITSAKLDTNIAVAGTLTVTGDANFDSNTLFVDSTNNRVGIGAPSPSTKLDILDANGINLRFGDIASTPSSQTAGYIGMSTSAYSGNNGDLVLIPRTSGTSRILLMEANVGIGTTSPVAKNHITGSGTSGQVTASWMLQNTSSGTAGMDITGAAGASRLRFVYGGGPGTGTNSLTEAMCMGTEGTYAGNVGIGDTNPRTQTTIVGAGQTTAAITDAGSQGGTLTLGQNSNAFNSGGALLFAGLNDGGVYTPQAAIKGLLQNGAGQGVGHLAFSMRASTGDTALAERLRILNGGGITFNGDTAAANALDDYEEGTFTPTVTATSGTLTLRTDYNLLGYTKIGRVVTITGMIVIGSISSPSGTLVIGDLPFEMFQDSVAASQTRPSIHLYAGGSGAPNAGYYSAFINFSEGTRAGALVITYNSTYDSACADWMSVGSDLFINFSYHTA